MTKYTAFFHGMRDTLPILLGVLPFGIVYGASAMNAHLTASITQGMSLIVFAGSAQFIALQLISSGIPFGIIILTIGIVNLRHALYSVSLAPYLKKVNLGWRLLIAYFLVDESYAVMITHYQSEQESPHKHWYSLGAGVTLWITWQLSTAGGIILGAAVPPGWSLDFALPLTFIALVVPNLKQKADVFAACIAGIVATIAIALPFNIGLLVATCLSIMAGMFLESRAKKAKARLMAEDFSSSDRDREREPQS